MAAAEDKAWLKAEVHSIITGLHIWYEGLFIVWDVILLL